MPLDASRNSLVLPMLGLLVEQPAHAYDVTARLRERYADLSATRSTVTSLLKALEKAGLVAARAPERVGNRPPRTSYALTDRGVADFRDKVEAGLRDARPASLDFVLAVSYAGILPADQAVSLLDARADRLDRESADLDVHPEGVAEAHMLEVGYWRSVLAAETSWLRTLSRRIKERDIGWPNVVAEGAAGAGS
ncbi:PadR family transcriptional regulator [Saccharothrix australiensis]|uniref:PadR family transcriptional regulator n=1 Tax=Saccharothrix australiensis TaxID=2072 RepID=A0A495W1W0_9PSEU|nr:helix-turn-helix transcriptional regulator [Saccharothrix australiensis]RKT55459.1 PadR family transcriptional regulator [Saccharothrix australiensis]